MKKNKEMSSENDKCFEMRMLVVIGNETFLDTMIAVIDQQQR